MMDIKKRTEWLLALVFLLDVMAIAAKWEIEYYEVADLIAVIIIMVIAVCILVTWEFTYTTFKRLGESERGIILKFLFYGCSVLSFLCMGYGIY